MIRIARLAAATLLVAGALTLFSFATGTVQRGLALCFAVLSAFWLALPFLESRDKRERAQASLRRALNSAALFVGTAIIAVVSAGEDPLLGGVGAVVAEAVVLFVWLMSVSPALAPFSKADAALRERGRHGSTSLQRRGVRLAVVFLTGAGSAVTALGLSSSIRVPSVLIVLVGSAWVVLTIVVIRRSTISGRSATLNSPGARARGSVQSGSEL